MADPAVDSYGWLDANPDAPLSERVAVAVYALAGGEPDKPVPWNEVVSLVGCTPNEAHAALEGLNDAKAAFDEDGQ